MRKSYSKKQLPFSYRDYLSNGESIPKGTIIQDYKIIKEIGKGAFGKIYLAQNANRESFALKLMDLQKIHKQPNPRVKEIRWRLVKNEPILMQQCNSPNVLKCFDIFENQALKLLVLEYCNGTTLQSYIDRKGKIKQEDAVKILRQIINGIAELHNHNIIHRDLKADNIMEHQGQYKIIDLGFSKKLDIQNEQQEVIGTTLGTVTTMAPEVLAKASYGLKADIWSIGVIFFQMVFGVLLYDTVTVRQRLKEIETKKYFSPDKDLTLNGTTISKEANNFLFRALEVNTEKRMGWRELLDHPLIKQKQEESIGSQFLVSYHLKEPNANENTLLVENQEKQHQASNRQVKGEQEQRANESLKNQKSIEQLIALKNQNEEMLLSQKENRKKEIQTLQQSFPDQKPKEVKKKYTIDINYSAKSKAIKTSRQQDIIDNNEESFSRLQQQEKYIINEQNRPKIQSQIPINRWQVNPNQIPNFYEHSLKKSFKKSGSHIEDSPDYIWVKQAHLQCLKSHFIYYQLIVPIERDSLLDLDDRNAIEFMFLLAARSFNNLSIIKYRIQSDNNEVKVIVKNLYEQVRELYKKVYEKFLLYSDRLTKSQNSLKEMFFDFFKKRFNKKEEDTKSSFTSGIECNNNTSMGDYSRAEQVNFTHEKYVQSMLSLSQQRSTQQVAGYIRNYKRIMTVSLQELDGETFEEFVKRVTS